MGNLFCYIQMLYTFLCLELLVYIIVALSNVLKIARVVPPTSIAFLFCRFLTYDQKLTLFAMYSQTSTNKTQLRFDWNYLKAINSH